MTLKELKKEQKACIKLLNITNCRETKEQVLNRISDISDLLSPVPLEEDYDEPKGEQL